MQHGYCAEAWELAVAAGASDERMMQLLRLLNRLLDKHPESRRRHLSFHTPAIVPVWMQVRRRPPALHALSPSSAQALNFTITHSPRKSRARKLASRI